MHLNVFAGLLHDALGAGKYRARVTPHNGGRVRVLVNTERAEASSFPFGVFEGAMLKRLRELSAEDLFANWGGVDELSSLLAEREAVEQRLARLSFAFSQRGEISVKELATSAKILERQLKELDEQIVKWRFRRLDNDDLAPGAYSLYDWLLISSFSVKARIRLRSALRATVDSVYLIVATVGAAPENRVCIAQVFFPDCKLTRLVAILHHGARLQPAAWRAFDEAIEAKRLDLRNGQQAQAVLAAIQGKGESLAALDLAKLPDARIPDALGFTLGKVDVPAPDAIVE